MPRSAKAVNSFIESEAKEVDTGMDESDSGSEDDAVVIPPSLPPKKKRTITGTAGSGVNGKNKKTKLQPSQDPDFDLEFAFPEELGVDLHNKIKFGPKDCVGIIDNQICLVKYWHKDGKLFTTPNPQVKFNPLLIDNLKNSLDHLAKVIKDKKKSK